MRLTYLLLALACAIVALRHGGGFVHPYFTLPLAATACYCLARSLRR